MLFHLLAKIPIGLQNPPLSPIPMVSVDTTVVLSVLTRLMQFTIITGADVTFEILCHFGNGGIDLTEVNKRRRLISKWDFSSCSS